MAAGDRFYLLELGTRPALWGDVGSLIRINGLVVGCGDANAVLMLPGLRDSFTKHPGVVLEPTVQEWSDFIQYSDDPQVYIQEGNAKVFHRKMRYAISGAVQQKIWAADRFACLYCSAKMGDTLLTIDHFVPLELGGANDETNFVSACRACNKKKGDKPPEVWIAEVLSWLGKPGQFFFGHSVSDVIETKVAAIKKYLKERKV